jgi:Excalibur calcium-binding domain
LQPPKPESARPLLRDLRNGVGMMILGVVFGGGAFLVMDSFNPPGHRQPDQGLSLRASYYQTCREALQDGHANIARGEPGYRRELDADNDGLACEPYAPR